MTINSKKIWLTWEKQRRSLELAKAFDAKLFMLIEPKGVKGIFRYFYLSIKTLRVLFKERPQIVFVQNPSLILAALLCRIKFLGHYKLIIDRHSNFKIDSLNSACLKWKIFHFLSRYTIKQADLTLVTNTYLADIVTQWGGRSFVLQDKLPQLPLAEHIPLEGQKNIVFVSTFSSDEPVEQVIEAARYLDKNWKIYITGKYLGYAKKNVLENLPENVCLTGYLSEKDYQSLLASSDLVIVLTTGTDILNCGAYESIQLSVPMVLSDTKVIRNYFSKGAVYTQCNTRSITEAIKKGIAQNKQLYADVLTLKAQLSADWNQRFIQLTQIIKAL